MLNNLHWRWNNKLIPIQKLNEFQIEQTINFLKVTKKSHFQKVKRQEWLRTFNKLLIEKEELNLTNHLNKNRNEKIISTVDKFIATVFPKDFRVLKN